MQYAILQYSVTLANTEQLEAKVVECLAQARLGAVLVSPCISRGEKLVMRTAFNEGFPLVILQENGFTDLAKPGGQRMDACSRGLCRQQLGGSSNFSSIYLDLY